MESSVFYTIYEDHALISRIFSLILSVKFTYPHDVLKKVFDTYFEFLFDFVQIRHYGKEEFVILEALKGEDIDEEARSLLETVIVEHEFFCSGSKSFHAYYESLSLRAEEEFNQLMLKFRYVGGKVDLHLKNEQELFTRALESVFDEPTLKSIYYQINAYDDKYLYAAYEKMIDDMEQIIKDA